MPRSQISLYWFFGDQGDLYSKLLFFHHLFCWEKVGRAPIVFIINSSHFTFFSGLYSLCFSSLSLFNHWLGARCLASGYFGGFYILKSDESPLGHSLIKKLKKRDKLDPLRTTLYFTCLIRLRPLLVLAAVCVLTHAEITGAVFLPLALGTSGRTRPNYGGIVPWDGPAGVYCYTNYVSPIVKLMKLHKGGVNQACRPALWLFQSHGSGTQVEILTQILHYLLSNKYTSHSGRGAHTRSTSRTAKV